jgi:hypothetical protein
MRDLSRARQAAKKDLLGKRQRILSLMLRLSAHEQQWESILNQNVCSQSLSAYVLDSHGMVPLALVLLL